MDLMYLSNLDLPGSLTLESRTSASSSSQVSMALPTCTHPVHIQPAYVCSLYKNNPHIVRTLYTDRSHMPQKIGFFVNSRISPPTLHATSDVRHFICIHKYLQESLHKKIDIQYVQVCFLWVSFVSYLYLHVALHFPYFRSSPFKIISFARHFDSWGLL